MTPSDVLFANGSLFFDISSGHPYLLENAKARDVGQLG
jgi:hypothetical protein